MPFHISDRLDLIPLTAGISSTTVGGTLAFVDWQSIVGVMAAGLGIILTLATLFWRWKEHRWRMRDLSRESSPDGYEDE